jgi:hypothetical protein
MAGRSVDELRRADGEENALFQAIRRHGAARELPLVIRTLAAIADGRIRLTPDMVTDASGRPLSGLDLTAEVEAALYSL